MDVGIYPVFLATLIFGEPLIIKSVSKISKSGVDEYTNMLMRYSGGATAHLLSSIIFNTPIEAGILGEKGSIKIMNPWFKATELSVQLNDGSIEFFNMPHLCNGFEHEITEVTDCLDKGLIQSPKVPHHLTFSVSKILDEIMKQAGVSY
jgi:predicted dehydrogenase